MKKFMLDILACPIDKHHPLELFDINAINNGETVVDGILFCPACGRFYPIIEEIPVMLPDELREKNKDIDFLLKWKDKIPDKVIKEGKPWHP